MLKLFFNRGLRNKVDMLTLQNNNLGIKNAKLETQNEKLENNIKALKTSLESTLNEVTELNTKLSEYKTANILLEKELLKKNQIIEIKEAQRKKNACKLGGLSKENNKLKNENKEFKAEVKELKKELDKRYILKTLKPTKPTKQTMSIKSSTVQSKIIKDIKGDYDETE